MHTKTKIHLSVVSIAFAVIAAIAVANQGFAWTNPSSNPPSGTSVIGVSGTSIGIGTASPAAKLHVVGAESRFGGVASGYMSLYNASGRSGYIQANQGTDLRIAADTDPMTFFVGGSERARITAAGNVSIGTASPDANYKITTANGGIKADANTGQAAGYFNNIGGGPAIIAGTGGITLGGVNQTSWPTGIGGSGTANYVAKWTAGSALGNSSIADNGSTVSVATPMNVSGTVHTTGDFLADGNFGLGLVGLYNPSRYRNVYSMGAAYRLAADGTGPGNLYGIANTYEPDYGGAGNNAQAKAGLGHQYLFMANGSTQTAIGTGIWTNGNTYTAGTLTSGGVAIINGGSSSNWASVNAPSFNAGTSIYSYGSICAGNNSGACSSTGGTVIGIANTGAINNIPNSGAVFFNSGNVGIGTTDPTSQMAGTYGLGIYNASYPGIGFKNSSTSWLWYGAGTTFRMWNASAGDMLVGTSGGNIGVGTIAPAYKLDVAGHIGTSGNLYFTTANPYISASSYFIAPGGAYFNSGTVYTEAPIQARGGIHDDAHANLTISGGTSGNTSFSGGICLGGVCRSSWTRTGIICALSTGSSLDQMCRNSFGADAYATGLTGYSGGTCVSTYTGAQVSWGTTTRTVTAIGTAIQCVW